jgi:hypothetical protein
MANFEKGPTEGNGRRVLFVSGDDRSAKQLVSDLITSFGYAVIDLGDLDEGGRFQQPGGPLAGKDLLLASWSQKDRSAVQMNGEMTMSGRLKGKVSLVTGGELGAAPDTNSTRRPFPSVGPFSKFAMVSELKVFTTLAPCAWPATMTLELLPPRSASLRGFHPMGGDDVVGVRKAKRKANDTHGPSSRIRWWTRWSAIVVTANSA